MSPQSRTFRGRSIAELLPQIRQELGPDAVITRQREGLQGGFAGFFQKQFVELEAQPGGRSVDVYDDGLEAPAIRELMRQASPFADELAAATGELATGSSQLAQAEPEPEPLPAPARRFGPSRPPQADAIQQTLVDSGLSARLASTIVSETVAHLLPFDAPRELRKLVRGELARRIPVQSTWAGVGRRIGFVGTGGAGKTLCAARLATTYADAGDRPVACLSLRPPDGGAELTELLRAEDVPVHVVRSAEEALDDIAGLGDDAVVVVDTPAVNPQAPDQIDGLAAELRRFLYEVHLALPAPISTPAAHELVAELAPLGVSRLVLTHLDATSHIGGAVELAIRNAKPFSFTSTGTSMPEGLAPADPDAIAALLLP
jgi:flagellar biosynthesis protein FlhF